MQGNTEQMQLSLISQLCGSITPEVWPGVEQLELYNKMELVKNQKRKVKFLMIDRSIYYICRREFFYLVIHIFQTLQVVERLKPYIRDRNACDLLDKLLILDPSKRIDSDSALNHDFFWTDPMPCDLTNMLAQHGQSMFEFLMPHRRPGHHVRSSQQQHQQPAGNIAPAPAIYQPPQNRISSTESEYHDRTY